MCSHSLSLAVQLHWISVGAAGGIGSAGKALAAVASGAGGGALGLALCLLAQSSLSLFSFLLGFWAAYGGGLLFGWSLSNLRPRGGRTTFSGYAGNAVALCSGAALAIGFGVLISHEMRAATYTMVEEDTSEERVLAEIPELAITETDREILSALEESPFCPGGRRRRGTVHRSATVRTRGHPRRFCRNFWRKSAISFPTRDHRPVRGNRHFVL